MCNGEQDLYVLLEIDSHFYLLIIRADYIKNLYLLYLTNGLWNPFERLFATRFS